MVSKALLGTIRQCSRCRADFMLGQTDRDNRQFCSKVCANQDRNERRYGPRPEIPCPYCAKPFGKLKDRKTFCSSSCSTNYHNAQNGRQVGAHRAEQAARERRRIEGSPCVVCGVAIIGRRAARYCSRACYRQVQRGQYKGKERTEAQCPQCGETFLPDNFGRPRLFCSDRCVRRYWRHTRDARQRGAFVAPVSRAAILERDNQTCQICGKRVRLDVQSPHPLSVSLDHIIPLAKGGTHEPSNVQLAHFRCNVIKSDRGYGQLRLVV